MLCMHQTYAITVAPATAYSSFVACFGLLSKNMRALQQGIKNIFGVYFFMCLRVLVRQAIELYGLAFHFISVVFLLSFCLVLSLCVSHSFILSLSSFYYFVFGFINLNPQFVLFIICFIHFNLNYFFFLAIFSRSVSIIKTKKMLFIFLHFAVACYFLRNIFVCAFRFVFFFVLIVFHVTFSIVIRNNNQRKKKRKKENIIKPYTHFFSFVARDWQGARVCYSTRTACTKQQFIVILVLVPIFILYIYFILLSISLTLNNNITNKERKKNNVKIHAPIDNDDDRCVHFSMIGHLDFGFWLLL